MQSHKHISCITRHSMGNVLLTCFCHIPLLAGLICCFDNLYMCLRWELPFVVAVTPWIKNTLSSPMGSQKNTWEHEQRNKGTRLEFFPLQKPQGIEKDSGSSKRLFHVLKQAPELHSIVGKPHLYLLLSWSEASNCRPTSVCLVIVNTLRRASYDQQYYTDLDSIASQVILLLDWIQFPVFMSILAAFLWFVSH